MPCMENQPGAANLAAICSGSRSVARLTLPLLNAANS